MVEAAAANGWLDRERVIIETLTAIRRAGAGIGAHLLGGRGGPARCADARMSSRAGSWRPFWLVAAALAVFLALDRALPGGDVPALLWVVAIVAVLGIVAAGTLSAAGSGPVRVDDDGLSVGRDRCRCRTIDVDHLREVDSGVDAGAPVLGGGWSLPKGRTGLPLRLTDGRTVLVPTRDPAALYGALRGPRRTPRRPPQVHKGHWVRDLAGQLPLHLRGPGLGRPLRRAGRRSPRAG